MVEVVYTSQVCYTDEDMHALRRIRLERKRTRHSDPKAYEDWTKQEEAIHDAALERYDEAKGIPKATLAQGIREAREPFCPPALSDYIETPIPPAALSEKVRASDSLFRGVEGSAPWAATYTPPPPPPLPVPWGAAQPQTPAPKRKAVRKKPL